MSTALFIMRFIMILRKQLQEKHELIYEFKPSDFYPVPNARICFAHFQRKTSADVEDAIDYRNFLSYIFLASGNTFKDKTKKFNSIRDL